MKNPIGRKTLTAVAAVVVFFAGWAAGKGNFQTQKTMIHCAAWTAKDGLTQAEFDQFKSSLSKLPDMFPGLRRVWIGKLAKPVTYNGLRRDHAIALEFENLAAKQAYSNSPRRPEWLKMFEAVRKPNSTNFDLVGE